MAMMTVDLRSDIVTLPTEEMRRAIYDAELGDDVSGEDPTVNRLEEMAAERMGKAAAVLVASGTQGNLLAILAHCRSGDEIIAGANSHIFWNESAGAAALGGIQTHLVPNATQGALSAELVEAAIRPGGDSPLPPDYPDMPGEHAESVQRRRGDDGGNRSGLPRGPRLRYSRCTWTGRESSMRRSSWKRRCTSWSERRTT